MTDYKALYEQQLAENEKLKEENEDTLASLNFYQEANKEPKEEIKELKEENGVWKTCLLRQTLEIN